jgi:hypothetical protein
MGRVTEAPGAEILDHCMRAIRAYAPASRVPVPPLDVWEVPHEGQRWIYIDDSAAAHGEEGNIYWTFLVMLDGQNKIVHTTHFRTRIGRNGRRNTLPPDDHE